jgi:hypothetical protein
VNVREYGSTDLDDCRHLYSQLVGHHRDIYHDPRLGGDDLDPASTSISPFHNA